MRFKKYNAGHQIRYVSPWIGQIDVTGSFAADPYMLIDNNGLSIQRAWLDHHLLLGRLAIVIMPSDRWVPRRA